MESSLTKIKERLKTVFQKLKNPKDEQISYNRKWLISFLKIGGVVFTISTIIVIGWLFLSISQIKYVTGVNLFRFPIIVRVLEEERTVEPFDSYAFETNKVGEIVSTATDADGRELNRNKYNLTSLSSTIVELQGPKGDQEYCGIRADVTALYYNSGEELGSSIKVVETISENSMSAQYNYGLLSGQLALLAANNYRGELLPDRLGAGGRVQGIYVVECRLVSYPEDLAKQLIWWRDLDAEQQTPLLIDAINQSESTPEYLVK